MLVLGALMLTPRLGRGYVECEVFFLFCFRDQTRVSLSSLLHLLHFPRFSSHLIFSRVAELPQDRVQGWRRQRGLRVQGGRVETHHGGTHSETFFHYSKSRVYRLCCVFMVDINVSELPMISVSRWTSLAPSSAHLVSQSHQDNDCHRGRNFGKSEIISAMSNFVLTYSSGSPDQIFSIDQT